MTRLYLTAIAVGLLFLLCTNSFAAIKNLKLQQQKGKPPVWLQTDGKRTWLKIGKVGTPTYEQHGRYELSLVKTPDGSLTDGGWGLKISKNGKDCMLIRRGIKEPAVVQGLDSDHWPVFQVLGGIVGSPNIIPKENRIFRTLASALKKKAEPVKKNTAYKKPRTGSAWPPGSGGTKSDIVRQVNTVHFFPGNAVSETKEYVRPEHTPQGLAGFPL